MRSPAAAALRAAETALAPSKLDTVKARAMARLQQHRANVLRAVQLEQPARDQ